MILFQACKFSLRLLGPLMESEKINNKFQKHLLEDANLIYGEFLNDLAKLIVSFLHYMLQVYEIDKCFEASLINLLSYKLYVFLTTTNVLRLHWSTYYPINCMRFLLLHWSIYYPINCMRFLLLHWSTYYPINCMRFLLLQILNI